MGLIEIGRNVTSQVLQDGQEESERQTGRRKTTREESSNEKRLFRIVCDQVCGGVQPGLSRGLSGDCTVCMSELLYP